MTATEVSRNFKGVLDELEANGDSVVVTRGGRRVAVLAPAPRANGKALRAITCRWRGAEALDDDFAEGVADVAAEAELDTDPWRV